MLLIRRQLFWQVYLTLIASLVAVTVLMAAFSWVMGRGTRERAAAFQNYLMSRPFPERDNPPGIQSETIKSMSKDVGADLSVYAPNGLLIASSGDLVLLITANDPLGLLPVFRMDLPDGRKFMIRRESDTRASTQHLVAIAIIVAGGVGLAVFPIVARLTRRLEDLRMGVERWGNMTLSTRLDRAGDDEVGVVSRAFNEAAERVEALLDAQKVMLANASHELRSPLARLRMAAELFVQRPIPELQVEIARNLNELDQLVEEILLASRLDHAGTSIETSDKVDLLGLAAEEGAPFDAHVLGASVEIEGNIHLLRRMIRNLLENAVKHGQPPIEITVGLNENTARVTVMDHGLGIDAAIRHRVFEPFFRPSGHTEAAGGWGLGLSLVRQIASRHGGSVHCDTGSNGGSLFTIQLPLNRS
jgi:signal transduction histidine kinase